MKFKEIVLLLALFAGASVRIVEAQSNRTLSDVFDMNFYLENNNDVMRALGANPTREMALNHWLQFGIKEGRAGSRWASPFAFAQIEAFNVFCGGSYDRHHEFMEYRIGEYECLLKQALRCTNFGDCMGATTPFSVAGKQILIRWNFGTREFDAAKYLAKNPDVASYCIVNTGGHEALWQVCAVKHYIQYGRWPRENRKQY